MSPKAGRIKCRAIDCNNQYSKQRDHPHVEVAANYSNVEHGTVRQLARHTIDLHSSVTKKVSDAEEANRALDSSAVAVNMLTCNMKVLNPPKMRKI